MALLFVFEEDRDCGGVLASARVVASTAGWPVRVLHVLHGADGAADVVRGELSGDVEVVDLGGDPPAEILAAARADDVSVVASCAAGIVCAHHGKLAERLLRDSASSLLIGGPRARPITRVERVLVPLEGSPSSSEAMRRAEEYFCAPGREIVALHVATADTPREPGSLPAPRFIDQQQYDWPSWSEEFAARFFSSQCRHNGTHRLIVRVGEPREIVHQEAVELGADVVVAAWNQRLAENHCERVEAFLEEAPCPLLLVPALATSPI